MRKKTMSIVIMVKTMGKLYAERVPKWSSC